MNKDKNILLLAYLGDAVYELYIRTYLTNKSIVKVNELNHLAKEYVSANSQSKFLKEMIENNFFKEDELDIIYRARNHKGSKHPKNASIITYKYATGLEALIGVLYLDKKNNRIEEIMEYIVGDKICL